MSIEIKKAILDKIKEYNKIFLFRHIRNDGDCVGATKGLKEIITATWPEKSVYIISGFMRLTREEAFAIRYHMGYSSTEDPRNVSKAFEMFPLAFALSTADSEATYFVETKK